MPKNKLKYIKKGGTTMTITITELRKKLNHYLKMSENEVVYITKHNKIISSLCSPQDHAIDELLKLKGILEEYDDGKPYEDMIGEALLEKYS